VNSFTEFQPGKFNVKVDDVGQAVVISSGVRALLSPDGNHYVGTFTLDAYDTDGKSTAHIIGVIKATRITVNTSVKDLM